jgi:hypothetical protein
MTKTDRYRFDISIVIVSFNTKEVLRECLQSVERETDGLRTEVFVVDHNSSEGSPEMVDHEFPQVHVMPRAVNLGFGAANNLAFQAAQGRYSVLLNPDAFLCPRSLTLAVEHMDKHPEGRLGGGKLVGRDFSWQPSARMFPSTLTNFLSLQDSSRDTLSPGSSDVSIEPGRTP